MESLSRTALEASTSVIPSPDVLAQELDGEVVILNLESERYFGLDEVGARVWRHLLEHRRLGLVCEEMQKEYDVDQTQLHADVFRLIEELIDAGIVIVEPDTPDESGSV